MKTLKIIGMVLAMAVMFTVTSAHADYTLDLRNDSDVVVKTYIITTNQVAHIQKAADAQGIGILTHFENALKNLVNISTSYNEVMWRRANTAYIEEQARQ